jgi:hypothetical protein
MRWVMEGINIQSTKIALIRMKKAAKTVYANLDNST